MRNLREAWAERRQVKLIASSRDFDSQFALLTTMHSWALQAAEEIDRVYDGDVAVVVSPPPGPDKLAAAFSVFMAESFTLGFSLSERRRASDSSWFVSVAMGSSAGGTVAAGPERRNGQWTRSRLEDLLLSVLGAWERSQADEPGPTPRRLRAKGA